MTQMYDNYFEKEEQKPPFARNSLNKKPSIALNNN